MYTPKAFEVGDIKTMHSDIKRCGLACLVTLTRGGLVATHLPVLLHEDKGKYGTLFGHLSKANAQWRESDPQTEALIIFSGLESYITPSWYATKQETGKVVPTWNYAAIHAYGHLSFNTDADWLKSHVGELTAKHESTFSHPWKITDAPAEYIDAQVKGIAGFEMMIERIEGKHKFNQNRSEQDRNGVISGLRKMNTHQKSDVASFMEQVAFKRNDAQND